jgi:multisubunit Na+/H+ antiporter MnhB subunit
MFLFPFVVGAQGTVDAESILGTIQRILNIIIPLLITFAVAVFIYGVITYVMGKDDGTKEKGRNMMISGIIGLFVIVAMWGLVDVLSNTFLNGNEGSIQNIPCIPGTSGC